MILNVSTHADGNNAASKRWGKGRIAKAGERRFKIEWWARVAEGQREGRGPACGCF
jgi:hypothetical protein